MTHPASVYDIETIFLLTHFYTHAARLVQYLSLPFATAFSTPFPSPPLLPSPLAAHDELNMSSSQWQLQLYGKLCLAFKSPQGHSKLPTTWTLWEVCWVLAWSRTSAICTVALNTSTTAILPHPITRYQLPVTSYQLWPTRCLLCHLFYLQFI